MRFLLLIIISTVCMQGCGNSKASPGKSTTTESLSVDSQVVAPLEVVPSQPLSDEGFRYIATQSLTTIDSGILKSRLETAISAELKALTEAHNEIVFTDDLVPLENGGEGNSGDISVFDGKYWYVGVSDRAIYSRQMDPGIDVWRVDTKSVNPSHVGFVPYDDTGVFGRSIAALFPVKGDNSDQLMVRFNYLPTSVILEKASLPNPQNRSMNFEWIDTDTLVAERRLLPSAHLSIDGQYIASTRVDDTLYVVSRYWAWLYGLNPYASGDVQMWFDNATTADYLPKYRLNGAAREALSSNCYTGESSATKSSSLINITAINLKTHEVTGSQCVYANVNHIFVSENSVFFGLDRPNAAVDGLDGLTELHQFQLDGQNPSYYGAGSVPGNAAWNSSNVGLTARDGALYVASTQRDATWSPAHNVHKVVGFDGQLKFSTLSDEPLLVGRELLEARYVDDRVYLVPEEVGESAIVADLRPQLSSHSIRFMPPNGLTENSDNSRRWIGLSSDLLLTVTNLKDEESWSNGLQLTLWDVKNSEVPVSLKTMTFEGLGTHSSSIIEAKELDINTGEDGSIYITLPISIYRSDTNDIQFPEWRHIDGVKLEISNLKGAPSMRVVESVVLAKPTPSKPESNAWAFRTLSVKDRTIYYFNGQVYAGQ